MTAYEPHPDSPAPKDGDRVRVGEVEGEWRPIIAPDGLRASYWGKIKVAEGWVYVVKGVPVTVLRPLECLLCGSSVREPVDLDEAVQVYAAHGPHRARIRAVLEWAGVPIKETP